MRAPGPATWLHFRAARMRSKSLAPPSIGRSWHDGQVRTPQTAVDRGRDRQAPPARETGHGAASDRQGADPQRGTGEAAPHGRRPRIGRTDVYTPVTTAQLVFCPLLEQTKKI